MESNKIRKFNIWYLEKIKKITFFGKHIYIFVNLFVLFKTYFGKFMHSKKYMFL